LDFEFFLYTLITLGLLLLIALVVNPITRVHWLREVVLLLLLAGIFYVGSLLFAFAFYFVVWHSIPSLKDQLQFLYEDKNLTSFGKYFKSSLWYWLASLTSLFLVYQYVDFEADYFMPLFFSFLAAITFPHTVVIGFMKHKND